MCSVKRLILFIITFCFFVKIENFVSKFYNIHIFVKAKKCVNNNFFLFLLNAEKEKNFRKKRSYIIKKEIKKKSNFLSSLTNNENHYEKNSEINTTDEEKYNLIKNIKKYCECTKKFKRLPTREVAIGNVKIGGNNRIAIQTMTSCDTRNVEECVYQIKKCRDLGADIVRLTVQGVQEAEASYYIKEKLLSENITIPLVADIHFNPKIALMAADVFEKIRINPGNYVDGRKKWINKIYKTKEEFDEGKLFIKEKFVPLIEKCKRLNRAIRIGTNHGSLSARMLSYYGDTPLGMVESAFEFSDLCIENNFYNVVFSMKASNAYVMIHSYRLLAAKQYEKNILFPIHLGVTEAGFGDNGRIKSYLGIGSLLYDGIGDTIRISLTEDPWEELIPCKKLIENFKKRIFYTEKIDDNTITSEKNNEKLNESNNIIKKNVVDLNGFDNNIIKNQSHNNEKEKIIRNEESSYDKEVPTNIYNMKNLLNFEENFRNFNNIVKRKVEKSDNILHEDCTVGNVVTVKELEDSLQIFKDLNLEVDKNGNLKKGAKTSDIIIVNKFETITNLSKKTIEKLMEAGLYVLVEYHQNNIDIIQKFKGNNILLYTDIGNIMNLLENNKKVEINNIKGYALILNGKEDIEMIEKIKKLNPPPLFILLKSDSIYEHVLITRRINEILHSLSIKIPLIHYVDINSTNYDNILVNATLYAGSCLIDLMGDGLIINVTNSDFKQKEDHHKNLSRVALNSFLTLNILQDTRIRLFKTDYIACPSCGRTLFNIQETTKKIMKLTGHLKGVKIAIMGCIVNGIGEMADAHFGYVGSAPKKIDLYYGKELVERNIPEEEACDKLIELIKKHNKWQDPPN
ncbi:4-hydroxy-3-methylbut-2-en-1-yl diphosphate synthase, putative [Plasmodium gallinaceum]|uniref:4-hydroxy-3-methylbut-2-en-1-yl diphosphate synthase (ferredoxin), chloroplastic n=1 Tax=Plasmodium gallinaceum TaxID=5849 RepID=A0A1J1H124_PLAGA|nr:4-hydroxy-3-methylbut-2-en-1-yl diphosphate synthase, putative [Plasmodium gallinaceum]CRG97242.1 4-hydroxy-3-methylbut-2-en-1-yl diphosphate synthase, putative [Plasmodium gallinaceum]